MSEENRRIINQYRLSKLYIWATISSFIILTLYYLYKFNKYYNPLYVFEFDVFSLVIFFLLIILMLLLLYKFSLENRIAYLFLFFTVLSSILVSHDFIHPTRCIDCEGNRIVASRLREKGITSFLKHYHKPVLYSISKSQAKSERFSSYDNLLKLNYKKQLTEVRKESSDVVLSNDKNINIIIHRISKHSPLWFCIIGLWQSFFGDSHFSYLILSNSVAILYLAFLYVLLGCFLKQDDYKDKLSILCMITLLPIFLKVSGYITNDLVAGILVIWLMILLIKNNKENIHLNDLLTGFVCSVAVLLKFTMIPLIFAVFLYYTINFKIYRALTKLIIAALCFSVMPVLLKVVFDYDITLNLITAATEEYHLISKKSGFITQEILWYGVHELYMFGIPLIVLFVTHLIKVRQYLTRNDIFISYSYIIFLFLIGIVFRYSYWSRVLVGYLPLLIPLLVHIYKNCNEKKEMVLSTCLFLSINTLLVIFHDLILDMAFQPR